MRMRVLCNFPCNGTSINLLNNLLLHLNSSSALNFDLSFRFIPCNLKQEGQKVMSSTNDGSSSPRSQLSSKFFEGMLDSIIVDVASECHRIARLGLDRSLDNEEEELRLSMEARASDPSTSEINGKNVVDIFGQTHPPIASEIFECMNCGRPVVAGRFAPHLEKCMGKGRKARQKTTRSTTMAQNRHSRGSPVSVYAPYSTNTSRAHNGSNSAIGEYSNYAFEGP